jgi:hypothetical protein
MPGRVHQAQHGLPSLAPEAAAGSANTPRARHADGGGIAASLTVTLKPRIRGSPSRPPGHRAAGSLDRSATVSPDTGRIAVAGRSRRSPRCLPPAPPASAALDEPGAELDEALPDA